MRLWTTTLECSGDCGEKIEITTHRKPTKEKYDLHGIAEALGWSTADNGHKQEVYCEFCYKRAQRIVKG